MSRGIIIAAPASGSGKTTITLALLRHLRDRNVDITSAKVGPDYIDPAFHTAASGRVCHNLDTWSMTAPTLSSLVGELQRDASLILVEGVMGLFDGAPDGGGSSADLSRRTGWPVVLVVDAGGMAASAAALVHGFQSFDSSVSIAGVIFNRTGSSRHGDLLRRAVEPTGVPVLGCVPRSADLELPDRHLGLVQAREHPDLETFLHHAAGHVGKAVDINTLLAAARATSLAGDSNNPYLPPLGQHIAVARDDAFAFCYPYLLDGWRQAGCEVSFFSPLGNQSPAEQADAVYLPGGYPELHAGKLAAATGFKSGLQRLANRGAVIYGECGGYMVLGECLVDAEGESHAMTALLPVQTSFQSPGLKLGYREVELVNAGVFGQRGTRFRGHEFHFASTLTELEGEALFQSYDAEHKSLGGAGLRVGNIMGSFVHLMDSCTD